MRVPIIKVDQLWHIGDLDITRKFARGTSQEGNLFSVSRCPAAWRQIVKLGGFDLHVGNAGYTLMDMLSITHPTTQAGRQLHAQVKRWAYQRGLLESRSILQGQYYDDELEQTCLIRLTEQDVDDAEPDHYERIDQVTIHAPTEKLCEIHNLRSSADTDAFDFALIEWARIHHRATLDGVYWNEDYKPSAYSAPRAGLFEANIEHLIKCDTYPDNEHELIQVGRISWAQLQPQTQYSQ
ncbi:hypothetical protein RBE51_22140 [Pseudomonas taiwanensis]|uniref:hypothetical protein n=1 Tax=Pseudomonas taiwanensis TaxID=470150 RepID=UPI0028DFD3D2|nr:hypothetical protein [Pseudomonas taiwanensis]MDT8925488.1 hypothetical protein [Pseudomonas taiwanensis]